MSGLGLVFENEPHERGFRAEGINVFTLHAVRLQPLDGHHLLLALQLGGKYLAVRTNTNTLENLNVRHAELKGLDVV